MSDSLRPHGLQPAGSSVHGIIQASVLQWVPFLLPGDLLDPGVEPLFPASPALEVRFFTTEPPAKSTYLLIKNK